LQRDPKKGKKGKKSIDRQSFGGKGKKKQQCFILFLYALNNNDFSTYY